MSHYILLIKQNHHPEAKGLGDEPTNPNNHSSDVTVRSGIIFNKSYSQSHSIPFLRPCLMVKSRFWPYIVHVRALASEGEHGRGQGRLVRHLQTVFALHMLVAAPAQHTSLESCQVVSASGGFIEGMPSGSPVGSHDMGLSRNWGTCTRL